MITITTYYYHIPVLYMISRFITSEYIFCISLNWSSKGSICEIKSYWETLTDIHIDTSIYVCIYLSVCIWQRFRKVREAAKLNAQSWNDLRGEISTCDNIWLDDLCFRDGFIMRYASSYIYSNTMSLINTPVVSKFLHWKTFLTYS